MNMHGLQEDSTMDPTLSQLPPIELDKIGNVIQSMHTTNQKTA